MNLSDIFVSVAHKRLVLVDLPSDMSPDERKRRAKGSNQHELNAGLVIQQFFGTGGPTKGTLSWHYFADDEEPVQEDGEFTFYDARAKSWKRTGRTEWRFYYYGDFLKRAAVGDLFFLVRTKTGKLFALVFQQKSAWLRAAQALFGVQVNQNSFESISAEALDSTSLELLQRRVLEELNLEVTVPVPPSDEEIMISKFDMKFPSTKVMSDFARTQVDTNSLSIDDTLLRWLDREEQLFRALENVMIQARLNAGFESSDAFIEYSLSVQNRRKSRMGHALQNHLSEIFIRQKVSFTAQALTEGNNRPDFIFPGQMEYHNPSFPQSLLIMLGVKSTSKDRWRQVLDEADRIERKHLCTLEAGISTKQTEAMKNRNLSLVIPIGLHATYTDGQRKELLSVESFVDLAKKNKDLSP